MKEKTENKTASTKTVPCTYQDCGVLEEQFPYVGKCCRKLDGRVGTEYEEKCPYCTVWISPPDPSSLDVAAFFECKRLFYSKRIRKI